MTRKRAILMRAAPGAGKSTLARQLAGRLGGTVYSADALMMAGDLYVWSTSLVQAAHTACVRLVRDAARRGVPVIIVDNTNIKVGQALPYYRVLRDQGYEVAVREPDNPWSRDADGLIARCTHAIPPETVVNMLAAWNGLPADRFLRHLEEHS